MFQGMNSLDTVEAVIAFEECFGVDLPIHDLETSAVQ
jgi:acyl carrier protein